VTKESSVLVEVDLTAAASWTLPRASASPTTCCPSWGSQVCFDLTVKTEGDLHIDSHHTVEDTAIALGTAFRQALGDKAGVRRFANSLVPLDETLVRVGWTCPVGQTWCTPSRTGRPR